MYIKEMGTISKTVVATGASSGLVGSIPLALSAKLSPSQGFEAIKQLLEQAQPYKFILGARDTQRAQDAYNGLKFDSNKHSVTVFHLELSDLNSVKTFAQQTLGQLGQDQLDYLLLNAGITNDAKEPGPHGSQWCEAYVVNHLAQHYLVHGLRDELVRSQARIVFVSSGLATDVSDPGKYSLDCAR